ncbi:hypothetical protein APG92_19555 [Salmonella enterica]|nr:hypothetical protein [Salmonella enterica]EBO3475407.1 hypothetical protein [Salmonella enterica]
MKNIKNLIIASALSIMAASCYAGSLVPNTSTGVSADVGCANKGSLVDGASHKWWVYDMADKVAVKLSGSQTVKADTYPVTLHIAEYQA